MKRKIYFAGIALMLFVCFNAFSFTNAEAIPAGLDCKWQQDQCPDESWREICLEDGDGNECKCGKVSRSCITP